ncbi:MAG: hypothetical protein PHE43_02960 [Candidatus Nanoarchaeia archaeon]|nr:hypothetical protein [Candidatus Nanoarchaeia archaeon]
MSVNASYDLGLKVDDTIQKLSDEANEPFVKFERLNNENKEDLMTCCLGADGKEFSIIFKWSSDLYELIRNEKNLGEHAHYLGIIRKFVKVASRYYNPGYAVYIGVPLFNKALERYIKSL